MTDLNNEISTNITNSNLETITEQSLSDEINTDYNNEYETLLSNNSLSSMNVFSDIINNNNQYTLLHDDDVNNPFYKCNVNQFDYDTDEEEDTNYIRLILSWNYEFN